MTSETKSNVDKTLASRNHGGQPLLLALGDRVRALRERHGITRKALAAATGVSERHLANLEYGEGNVSVLVLDQVAGALQCSLAELIGDFTTRSPEWLLLRSMLSNRNEATLRRIRIKIGEMLAAGQTVPGQRIALIGLRGAGKSTLGIMLAEHLGYPFIELRREIENQAACTIGEIQALYGMSAYRRYERRALQTIVDHFTQAVIATPGGLVAETDTYNLLLANCATIWIQAKPQDHMRRVIAQGDFRPMAGSSEAMTDLKRILAARQEYYAKAPFQLDTSAQNLEQTFSRLCAIAAELEQDSAERP